MVTIVTIDYRNRPGHDNSSSFSRSFSIGLSFRYYVPMLYLTISFVTTMYFRAFLPDTLPMLQ